MKLDKLTVGIQPALLRMDNDAGPSATRAILEATANINQLLDGLRAAHIVVVNIGAEDILTKKQDLVLGVVWQLIRTHLLESVNLASHPELIRLLQPGESLPSLISLSSEQILLRWFNYHLERAQCKRRITSFKDVTDSELYIHLMKQLGSTRDTDLQTKLDEALALPSDTDTAKETRAKLVLEAAEVLKSRRFVTAQNIVNGHARLNLLFTATLFNHHIGIHLPTEEEARKLFDEIDRLERLSNAQTEKIRGLTATVQGKDSEIATQKAKIEALEAQIQQLRTGIKETEQIVMSLEKSKSELKKEDDLKINHLEKTIADLNITMKEKNDYHDKQQKYSQEIHQAYRTKVASEIVQVRDVVRRELATKKFDVSSATASATSINKSDGITSRKVGTTSTEQLNASHEEINNKPSSSSSSSSSSPTDPEVALEELRNFVRDLLEENHDRERKIEVLATKLGQHEKVAGVIGDKVKEYAESVIKNEGPIKIKKDKHLVK